MLSNKEGQRCHLICLGSLARKNLGKLDWALAANDLSQKSNKNNKRANRRWGQ